MSDEQEQQTEAPTPRRLQRAMEEGQIGFSNDLMAGVVLLAGAIFFFLYGRALIDQLKTGLRLRLTYFETMIAYPQVLPEVLMRSGLSLVAIILGLMLPLCAVAMLAGGLQTQFNISFKPLEFKTDRMNPITGWQRIWSIKSAVRGINALIKSVLVGVITYYLISSKLPEILLSGFLPLEGAVQQAANLFIAVAMAISTTMVLLGVADLGFQKWRHYQEMRMSMHDIRKETKEDDGDPMMKARLRRLGMELTKQSINRDVPKATVVITNPTHFAVALKFDRATMTAPIVVAKGSDHMAKKIIEVAKKNGVAVVERKSVARFLYFKSQIGKAIPVELYMAVAEIINFVNRFQRAA